MPSYTKDSAVGEMNGSGACVGVNSFCQGAFEVPALPLTSREVVELHDRLVIFTSAVCHQRSVRRFCRQLDCIHRSRRVSCTDSGSIETLSPITNLHGQEKEYVAHKRRSPRFHRRDVSGGGQLPRMDWEWLGNPVFAPKDFTPVCTMELGAFMCRARSPRPE